MKTLLNFLVLMALGISFGQEKLDEVDLTKFVNKKVQYCDIVEGTFVTNGNKRVVLLNMGDKYPNHKLVVAIFEENWKNFDYKPEEFLDGKHICVSGKLVIYKDKPEIIVKHPEQIALK